MRAQNIEEAETSINYLKAKLKETNIAGMLGMFTVFVRAFIRTPVCRIEQSEIRHPKQDRTTQATSTNTQ